MVLVMGQTLSMPDKTRPLPPPYVPVPRARGGAGVSASPERENRGCRGVWEMQKPLANSEQFPGRSSHLDSGQQERRFSGPMFF